MWRVSNRFDRRGVKLADRHYSRQKPGTPQFVRAGYNIVLITPEADGLWVTVYQPFVDHAWPGAWECTLFRNENPERRASGMILEALAATRAVWGDPPPAGMITTVDAKAVRSKRNPGHCFVIAGFRHAGETRSGKLVFHIGPESFPDACLPVGYVPDLFGHTKHLKSRNEYSAIPEIRDAR